MVRQYFRRQSIKPGIVAGKLVYGLNNTGTDLDNNDAHADGNAPTWSITLTPSDCTAFKLTGVWWYLANANAVTHELYLYENNTAAAATQREELTYDSGSGLARNTQYAEVGSASSRLPVDVYLATAGTLYGTLDYSGAPGTTTGHVKVRGILMDRE